MLSNLAELHLTHFHLAELHLTHFHSAVEDIMSSACWSGYSPASWTLRMFHKPIFSSLFKTESTAWQVLNQRHGLVKMVHDDSSFSNSKVRYISKSDTPTHCLSHTHWHFGFSLESHCHGLRVQNCFFFMSRASGMKILHYKPHSKRQICRRMKLRHRVTFHTESPYLLYLLYCWWLYCCC